jgi:DNA repair protein RecN (Recombination protein N)
MLSSLHIENIAVIKQADIDLESGLHVLTGETGAGKSILIDSIELLLGARPSKDLIRNGEKKATVSAMFTDINACLNRLPDDFDITPDEDGCLVV